MMAVFGWLCLLAITAFFWLGTIAGVIVSHGFSGRVDHGVLIFLALDAALTYAAVITFPFTVALAP